MVFLLLFLNISWDVQINLAAKGLISSDECKAQYSEHLKQMVYSTVDNMPEFPGGSVSLHRFALKELRLTNEEWEDVGKYIELTFIVDQKGKCHLKAISKNAVKLPNVKMKVDHFFEKMPIWKPGKCNGKSVLAQYVLVVRS